MTIKTASEMHTTCLRSGEALPVLGQGTWYFGEDPSRRADEIASLQLGIDLGMSLIDTSEMYGHGAAEGLIAEAIEGRRDEVFLVTKVVPQHATLRGTITACEQSLQHLRTDHIDMYLLHWRQEVPLEETMHAFELLTRVGKIRFWGVSNFDMDDLGDLLAIPGGHSVATDQVLYNLTRRGIEWELLKWCQRRGLPLMTYSPVEQGRLLDHPVLEGIAERYEATPAQIALAWVLRHPGVLTIVRASHPEHVRDNRAALDIRLASDDLAELDRAFPPPAAGRPLEML